MCSAMDLEVLDHWRQNNELNRECLLIFEHKGCFWSVIRLRNNRGGTIMFNCQKANGCQLP